jgi:hypothetical protein
LHDTYICTKDTNIFINIYVVMIKNMLTRRKESDTFLATVGRHRWSRQITMKIVDESHSAG